MIFAGGAAAVEASPSIKYFMGVAKSVDFGATWQPRTLLTATGSDYESYSGCRDLAVAAANPQVVYAVGCENNKPRVFRSTNGGTGWSEVTGNLASVYTGSWYGYAVCVDARDASRVFVGTSRGVYMSTAGGDTWSAAGLTQSTPRLLWDARTHTLYAGTESSGVYARRDGETTFTARNTGLGCTRVRSMGLDPVDDYLFVGTYRGGVWRTRTLDAPTPTPTPTWTATPTPTDTPTWTPTATATPNSARYHVLLEMACHWNETEHEGTCDRNGDHCVDVLDLLLVLEEPK